MSRWEPVVQVSAEEQPGKSNTPPARITTTVRSMEETIELTTRRFKQIEKILERYRVSINDIRASTARFDDLFTKTNGDIQCIQQQLEYVLMSLEKERGIVAAHTEQLRLFARESNRRNGRASETANNMTMLLLWLATWLYQPLIHFVKGCYTLLSPLIHTLQSLSLFNSSVLLRQTQSGKNMRNTDTSEDLLKRLQAGMLDPTSLAKKS